MTMTDVNPGTSTIGPCVSLATGTLSPDQRVNYAYGMVLGLDEFLQEQLHTLAKDYLHERALHGFGTVSGLAVSAAPVDGASDFQISAATGIAIDQWGREIVVRCDQCVRLGAWLAAQERHSPGILGQHLGPSGEVTVYVVASYAECLDRLVPLPGQPCSSSSEVTVASRIRDAWDLELRWAPPAMPRWDTDRRLARLLDDVTVVAGLGPADSDEAEITDAVRALAGLADNGPGDLDPEPGPSGAAWQLPAATAAAALDRILTVWVTEVRPALHLDLIEPGAASDPAVLLSAVTFVPAAPFDVSAPAITACDDPDDDGRPYLLHTELIQELHRLGVASPGPKETKDLVTLAAQVDASSILVVDAWFHLDDPVRLPDSIEVRDETGGSQPFSAAAVNPDANGFSSDWTLQAPGNGVMTADGLQISALFPAATILVKDATTTLAQVQQHGPALLNADEASGDVTAYAEVRGRTAVVTPPSRPNVEFVTVTDLRVNAELAMIELWFHIEPHGIKDDAFAVKPAVRLFDDTTGNPLQFQLSGPASWSRNVWRAEIRMPSPGKGIPLYIRHQYLTTQFEVETPGGSTVSLADWIAKNELSYIGSETGADRPDIIVFSRTVVPDEITQLGVPSPAAQEPAAKTTRARRAAPGTAPARRTAARKAGENR
jgi:hypothetical protein